MVKCLPDSDEVSNGLSGISSLFSIASNGLTRASNQMTATAQNIVNDTAETGSDAGINIGDLAQHVVDLVSEKTAFQASALLLKTGDQMVGTLLDMFDTPKRN